MNILLAVDTSKSARAAVSAVVSQFAGQAHHVRLFHVTEWDSQMPMSLQFAQGPTGAKAVIEFVRWP